MVPLSEKAKGKRRATDPPEPSTSIKAPLKLTEITIRFTEGIPDVSFTLDPSYTVNDVKALVREYRPTLSNRRLRLIHAGRLLQDNIQLYDWLMAHARQSISSEDENLPTKPNAKPIAVPPHVLVQCAIGPVISEEDSDFPEQQTAQIAPLRGFDRLIAAGLSESEVASIRRQFHADSSFGLGGENPLDTDLGDDVDYEEHARLLEDQWLDSLDSTSLSRTIPAASAGVVQGLFLGFFFPLIPFFFFTSPREPIFWEDGREADRPRSVIFSRRTQMAIVVGFGVNITFGLWRMLVSSG